MAKVRTTHIGGSRFYVDTESMQKVPGVTSVIGMLAKPFLQPWAAKMSAELAVDSLDYLPALAKRDRDGAVDFLKGASRRYSSERARIGSEAHDLMERMIRGESVEIERGKAYLTQYRDLFQDFLDTVQPELIRAEDASWSDTHGFAGSFDAVLELKLDETGKPDPHGESHTIIVDWKTSKSTYSEVALQLAAYRWADRIISPDGTSEPMPAVDGAAVFHITAQDESIGTKAQWSLKPVRTDKDDVFATFLHLLEIFKWDKEISKTVIGKPLARSASRFISGTERRSR